MNHPIQPEIPSATPVRLALVSGGLPLGGATTFLCNLAGPLIARGVPCRVFSLEHAHPMRADFDAHHIPVFTVDETREIYEDRLAKILAALREFQPTTVVSTLSPISFEILRYLPEGIQRLGMIQSDHESVYSSLFPYSDWLDGIVGVSREICEKASQMAELKNSPVHHIPYGVPMPDQERPPYIGPVRILYFGRLEQAQKRVRLFPEIYQYLLAANIPFVWTIAGDGPELSWLKEQMPTHSPHQQVHFIGKVAYTEVPDLLSQQDIFLLASDHEGLPLSLLEAMGQGLVPVVSDMPSGIPEVVHAENGYRVDQNHIKGYADAIVELANNPALLKSKGAAARETVRAFYSTQAMADRWLAILKNTPSDITWPDKIKILPLQNERLPFLYSPLLRPLRRWFKKIRQPHQNLIVPNSMNCPICNESAIFVQNLPSSDITEKLREIFHERPPGNIDDYAQYRCPNCQLVFFDPMKGGDVSFYNWLASKSGYYPERRKEWDILEKMLAQSPHENKQILEVGCGSGIFLKRLAQLPGVSVHGLDLSPDAVKLCIQKGISAYCDTVENYAKNHSQKFDYVMAFHCLEHVPNPRQFLASMLNLLNPGGSVFVSTPHSPLTHEFFRPDVLNRPPHHLTQWNQYAYQSLADQLNATVEFWNADYRSELGRMVSSIERHLSSSAGNNAFRKLWFLAKHPFLAAQLYGYQLKNKRLNGKEIGDAILVKMSPR